MLTEKIFALSVALGMSTLTGLAAGQPAAGTSSQVADQKQQAEPMKVIYHVNDSEGQALAALRNMRNHLDVAPNTKIVLIAHADGIDFLRTDYKDAEIVESLVSGLASRGVVFEVCEITIDRKKYSKDDFLMEASFTPSGVARIAELQIRERYAYIKP